MLQFPEQYIQFRVPVLRDFVSEIIEVGVKNGCYGSHLKESTAEPVHEMRAEVRDQNQGLLPKSCHSGYPTFRSTDLGFYWELGAPL